MSSPSPASSAPDYWERLRVPLRWWAVGTMFWASFLVALLVALPAALSLALTAVLAGLNALVFVSYGAAMVSVSEGRFRAGRAEVPVHLLGEVEPLDAEEARRAAGVEADARAYLVLRPYLRRAVRVRLHDPADPTPYWLVATRRPRALATALERAITVSAQAHRAD